MSKLSRTTPDITRIKQDLTLDKITSGVTRDNSIHGIPMSLRPDERVAFGAAIGNPYCKAIVDAWKPIFTVTKMRSEEFDSLSERATVTFHGQVADRG